MLDTFLCARVRALIRLVSYSYTFVCVCAVHYAEADNELHHLLIMESLGGNKDNFDRSVFHGDVIMI